MRQTRCERHQRIEKRAVANRDVGLERWRSPTMRSEQTRTVSARYGLLFNVISVQTCQKNENQHSLEIVRKQEGTEKGRLRGIFFCTSTRCRQSLCGKLLFTSTAALHPVWLLRRQTIEETVVESALTKPTSLRVISTTSRHHGVCDIKRSGADMLGQPYRISIDFNILLLGPFFHDIFELCKAAVVPVQCR